MPEMKVVGFEILNKLHYTKLLEFQLKSLRKIEVKLVGSLFLSLLSLPSLSLPCSVPASKARTPRGGSSLPRPSRARARSGRAPIGHRLRPVPSPAPRARHACAPDASYATVPATTGRALLHRAPLALKGVFWSTPLHHISLHSIKKIPKHSN